MQKVIVGSKNPVKVNATRIAFESVFPNQHFNVEGIKVPSGVADQPFGEDETYQGAWSRANNARNEQSDSDYWVGIESGICNRFDTLEVFNWFVVIDRAGNEGCAKSGSFMVPTSVAALINQGQELADACFQVFGDAAKKTEGGLVGYLTGGTLDRTRFYVPAIELALAAILHPELYQTTGQPAQRLSA